MKSYNAPQPAPLPVAGDPVWPAIIREVKNWGTMGDDVRRTQPLAIMALAYDMGERHLMGIRKYGVPLTPGNGRDFMVDAYQEALDLCAYLKGAVEEGFPGAGVIYSGALTMAFAIRCHLLARDGLHLWTDGTETYIAVDAEHAREMQLGILGDNPVDVRMWHIRANDGPFKIDLSEEGLGTVESTHDGWIALRGPGFLCSNA